MKESGFSLNGCDLWVSQTVIIIKKKLLPENGKESLSNMLKKKRKKKVNPYISSYIHHAVFGKREKKQHWGFCQSLFFLE